MITQKRLKELLTYEHETGYFYWKKNNRKVRAGAIAGSIHNQGYIQICIDYNVLLAHRVAWFYVHGIWSIEIDHRDHDKTNNKLSNLRDVSRSGNMQNQVAASKRNKSGYLGVDFKKDHLQYRATIRVGKKTTHLGYYDTAEEAHAAYVAAKRIHHHTCTI
jgi:hypothetical protein